MMRILTFNMWGKYGPWRQRWKEATRVMPRLRADIFCLQEATDMPSLKHLAHALDARIVIADASSTGLAILARVPFRRASLTPYETRSPFEWYIRKFQLVEIIGADYPFHLVNTHLSWKPGDDASRKSQAAELKKLAHKLKTPTLLCGDFNCTYPSDTLKNLRQAGFSDVLSGTKDAKRPTWDNANPFIRSHSVRFTNRRIDLMLPNRVFRQAFRLESAQIVYRQKCANGLHLSDHYGVRADFALKTGLPGLES